MKTKLSFLLVLFVAGALAVSCGKNKSGGGGSSNGYGSIAISGNLDSGSQQALRDLNNWNASSESKNLKYKAFERVDINTSSSSNQQCLELWGINLGCINWGGGTSSNPDIIKKTCVRRINNNTVRTGRIDPDQICDHYNLTTDYNRANNTELNEVFNNGSGLVVVGAQRNGSLISVWLGYPNSSPVKMVTIDISVHSIYNPVQIVDSFSSKVTYVWNI